MPNSRTTENPNFARAVFWGMGISALFFTQDVLIDLFEHIREGNGYSTSDLTHLIFEALAVAVLVSGMPLLSSYVQRLRSQADEQLRTLHNLTRDFDSHVRTQFGKWDLSPAENDVALLLLRGLSISDIADLRGTAVGTVKVHSHNIFRKAGVTSRVELMSLFLDEFMDVGLSHPIGKDPA